MPVALLVPLADLLKTTVLLCAYQEAAGFTIVRFCGQSDCPDKKLVAKVLMRSQTEESPAAGR